MFRFWDSLPCRAFLGPAGLSYPGQGQLPDGEGHLLSQRLAVLTNRSGCFDQHLLDMWDLSVPEPCCLSQICVLWAALPCASLVIVLLVLQYLLPEIVWDPSSDLQLLRLPPSPVTSKDLSPSLPVPAAKLQAADHHPSFSGSGTALFAGCLNYFKRCHGILVFSGSAPRWAHSCELCIHCVRNDSRSWWHHHLGSNSTAKLPARKKAFISCAVFAVGSSH